MSEMFVGLSSRLAAHNALAKIWASQRSEVALTEVCSNYKLSEQDKSLVWAMVMAILRNRALLDAAIDVHLREGKVERVVRDILRIGAAQLILLDRIPPHAAVSTSVELARHLGKEKVTGLMNAVLRKLVGLSEDDIPLPSEPSERIAVRYSHPLWLVERWEKSYGSEFTGALAAANNVEPPLTLRVNTRKTDRHSLLKLLNGQGIEAEAMKHFPEYIKAEAPGHPSELPGFTDGLFSVQDPAFSLPVDILAPLPGERILEIGCAPGGKLSHIAERFGKDVVIDGVDISEDRLETTASNLDRLGLSEFVKLHHADACEFGEPESYDAVLLDAPCTSTGVIRRHPEIRYNRTPKDIERMSDLQRELIIAALRVIKPGGRLIYCACSAEPEEGEEHLKILPPGVKTVPPEGDFLQGYCENCVARTWPHLHNLDGMIAFLVVTPR